MNSEKYKKRQAKNNYRYIKRCCAKLRRKAEKITKSADMLCDAAEMLPVCESECEGEYDFSAFYALYDWIGGLLECLRSHGFSCRAPECLRERIKKQRGDPLA